jgi:hypothetical protein
VRALLHRITKGLDTDAIEDIALCQVRQDPPEREGADPDDADPNRPAHAMPVSAAGKSTPVDDE